MAFLKSIFFITISLVFTPANLAASDAEFTYHGIKGPENWATLSTNYTACATEQFQSPINIITSQATLNASLEAISLSYQSANAVLVNNNYNIEVEFIEDGGDINVNNKDHTLQHFHFHVPSEHQFDGQHFAAELHIVHQAIDGSSAVVAILYNLGQNDTFISQINGSLNTITNDPTAEVPIGSIQVSNILPNINSFYRYIGSLTTPPCTGHVSWSVVSEAKTISVEQVEAIRSALSENNKENNRPIQPLNGRLIQLRNGTEVFI